MANLDGAELLLVGVIYAYWALTVASTIITLITHYIYIKHNDEARYTKRIILEQYGYTVLSIIGSICLYIIKTNGGL